MQRDVANIESPWATSNEKENPFANAYGRIKSNDKCVPK